MVFKVDWEKAQQRFVISDELLQSIIYSQIEDGLVQGYQIISGGCANLNIKVILRSDEILIFRIYIRDGDTAKREKALYESLKLHHVPVPQIRHYFSVEGYTVSVMDYIEGRTLRDVLLEYRQQGTLSSPLVQQEVQDVMYDLGQVLSHIRTIPLHDISAANLECRSSMGDLEKFVQQICKNSVVMNLLTDTMQDQIRSIFSTQLHVLEEGKVQSLVHGDYDPSNILVHTNSDTLKIAAILDWEFAHIGTQVWDIANMLRYKHEMPKLFEDAFLQGVQGDGQLLPDDVEQQIALCNLISLLDCLRGADIEKCPKRIKDIIHLVSRILQSVKA